MKYRIEIICDQEFEPAVIDGAQGLVEKIDFEGISTFDVNVYAEGPDGKYSTYLAGWGQ